MNCITFAGLHSNFTYNQRWAQNMHVPNRVQWFNRSRHFMWFWMPFINLRDIYKKGYFPILSHSFLIWLQSFNKLQIRPSKKWFKKIEIRSINADFMLSSNMKNFSQKSYKKMKVQKTSFLCFYSYKAIFYGV